MTGGCFLRKMSNVVLFAACFLLLSSRSYARAPEGWQVETGFSLNIDSSGYELPTTVTFLNKPGSDPSDTLYLVAELRGAIKRVTNDRKVETFATSADIYDPAEELPDVHAEIGQIGLCINQDDTKLFSTLAAMEGKRKR